jgi:hypothetical protein
MNPIVQESTRLIKIINRHLEEPCCNHSIQTILIEAYEEDKEA